MILFGDNLSESWNTIRGNDTVKPLRLASRNLIVDPGLGACASHTVAQSGPCVGREVGPILNAIGGVRHRGPADLDF